MSSNKAKAFILDGARTPFGKFGGTLGRINPVDLAVNVSKNLIERHKIDLKDFDHVIFSNVIPSTTDTLYGARHVALKLGMPETTPGYSVNRLCGSGIQAIWEATNMIELGLADLVLVAGSENMSLSPHLTYGARFGTKYGALKSDDMLLSTLSDKFTGIPMGETAEKLGGKFGVTRNDSDVFSFESHKKASEARKNNLHSQEIISYNDGKVTLDSDEHIRDDVSLEDMQKLRSSFVKDGLVTPGSASGIVDGAAVLIVCSEKYLEKTNKKALSKIIDFNVIGVDPTIMGYGPVPAIENLLKQNNLSKADIDLFEVNEAFSAQALACVKKLELPSEKVNVWGGAVAIGHPLGATGTRLALTASYQLKSLNKKRAIASACIGGGQGIAMLIENS